MNPLIVTPVSPSRQPGPEDSEGSVGAVSRTDLCEGWRLSSVAGPAPAAVAGAMIPATVPGCVHTDLLAAGLIDDPYLDDNEAATSWIGLSDWEYRREFTWHRSEATRHDLVFEGLDTVGEITLNGVGVGRVDNMHRTWRFDVTAALQEGDNELVVTFRSPVKYADRASLDLGMRPRPYPTPYNAIRKMASSFGWDWGIATATSGIWRPVSLESWSAARLALLLVEGSPRAEGGGRLRVRVGLDRTDGRPLGLRVRLGAGEVEVPMPGDRAEAILDVPEARLWWPRGHGDQPLYDVEVAVLDGELAIDTRTRRIGFRDVQWHTEPDHAGTPFQLHVNGLPVYVRGANWVPDDAFVSRIDRPRYQHRLQQAAEANLNLIRVWGGGIFEADDFYEVCDELGLLTWQDCLLACAAYSEDEPLRSSIEAETRDNLARIAHHPSLVLINGNNENLVAFEDWGWQRVLDGQTWGATYYHDLFPALVAELAPGVPYAPGSPFSPHGEPANDERHGSVHIWDVWNELDWSGYRAWRPRFVAEFGWQGPPAWSTLTRAVHDDPLTPESPGMLVHQKALDGNTKLNRGLIPHLRVPTNVEDWHWAMQLNQAWAIKAALTHFRSLAPYTTGAVVWQLNDCWPVVSWAAIDGDGHPKPVYHAIREAYAPRLVTVQPTGEGLQVVVANDTQNPWPGTLCVRRLGFDGTELARADVPIAVAPRELARVAVPADVARAARPAAELLDVGLDGVTDRWFFAEARDCDLADPRWQISLRSEGDVLVVRVTPDTLVRDAYLMVDKVDPRASVDAGLITLLPGESAEFRVRGAGDLTAEQLGLPTVLRTANQLVFTG